MHVPQSTGTLIQRKPASVLPGGQPKPKLESPKQPALVRRTLTKKAPIQAIVEKPVITTNNNNTGNYDKKLLFTAYINMYIYKRTITETRKPLLR